MRKTGFCILTFVPSLAAAQALTHTVEYKMENYTTVVQVLTPAGAQCHVKSDSSWFGEQDFEVPFKFKAQADFYYTFDCKVSDGQVWHQRLEPKANHTTIVKIGAATPPQASMTAAPAQDQKKVALSKDDFAKLLAAMKKEAFEDKRLKVLSLAAKSNYFNVEQVGALVDAFEFGEGKTNALKTVSKRIIDPENNHLILSHFTFDDDKDAAEEILAAK